MMVMKTAFIRLGDLRRVYRIYRFGGHNKLRQKKSKIGSRKNDDLRRVAAKRK